MDNYELRRDEVFSIMERPVHFESKGKNIFAIFRPAVNNAKKVGVIFLNAGFQYRVGPHRIYIKTARRLSQIGFPSLSMDFSGLGDSEGEIRDIHFDCYDVEDALRAVDFLAQQEKIGKVVLLGLCAGARNAIKAAARDTRIDSIILWSLPFYAIPNSPTGKRYPQSLRRTDVKHYLGQRVKKALNIRLLIKYFSGYEKLASIKDIFRDLVVGVKNGNNNNMHREFFEAFELFLSSKRKAFFVYGERDDNFKKMFEEKFEELSDDERRVCEYYIVPNGDHTFASVEAEKTVIEKTAEWLVQQYGLKITKD